MRNEVACICGLSDLVIDYEESKKEPMGITVYRCDNCNRLYILQHIRDKELIK